jgi:hypothetical protein
MVGYSRDGKASNLPIVLTDSTLISIRKGETLLYHLLRGFSRCLCSNETTLLERL